MMKEVVQVNLVELTALDQNLQVETRIMRHYCFYEFCWESCGLSCYCDRHPPF